ncbi:MAG: phospho-sugar mutase [Bacteroidales bacterium]|nr:phospho-sugar mutase [Bacteroidales bacterium]MDT8430076.1 phospho-sugar mutase [Bacteroidales bacterium]
MEKKELLAQVKEKAQQWLNSNIDDTTRKQIEHMLEHDEKELIESFYRVLEFGTGGLRGIMGVGTNRMNIYTVGMATQGLCNYLLREFSDRKEISVVIAHDCRNNSPLFARTTADVCSANGIKAYLFDGLRPTPELSFAIRELNCQAGVMVTASHNPKEYNGYKAYWEDGGQIISPHDVNIVEEVKNISSIDDVKFEGDTSLIQTVGKEVDEKFLATSVSKALNVDLIEKHSDIRIVYTPIHGTGVYMVPEAMRRLGFKNIYNVPEQDVVSGDFPTVVSPNPEESAALDLALKKADEVQADMVMATDPDADRVGIAVRDNLGKLILVNGNQMSVLLTYYLLSQWSAKGLLQGKEFMAKTIVTTELVADIYKNYDIQYFDVLTGFKFIADMIHKYEDELTFIGGGEESYGFMIGDFVRDKDAVTTCSMIAEIAAWAREQGKSLFDLLLDIYQEYAFYRESLVSVYRHGKEGAEEIAAMMENFRSSPPAEIDGSKVVMIKDFLLQKTFDKMSGKEEPTGLPKSNVLQFLTENGTKVSVRPSGTEPKIKFYFSVRGALNSREEYEKVNAALGDRIEAIKEELKLN